MRKGVGTERVTESMDSRVLRPDRRERDVSISGRDRAIGRRNGVVQRRHTNEARHENNISWSVLRRKIEGWMLTVQGTALKLSLNHLRIPATIHVT